MKKRVYLFLLVVASLTMILIGCGNNNSSNTTNTDIDTDPKEPVVEIETETVTEIETESVSIIEQQTEETEDTRVAKETGRFILNVYHNGDPKKENLWDGYENKITIRLYDNNDTKILDEKHSASDEIMTSLSGVLSNQIPLEDIQAFYNENEADAVESVRTNDVFEIDVTDKFDPILNFTYNNDEIEFHIKEVSASVITFLYDTDKYSQSDFFTKGCILYNMQEDHEYIIQAGGVEYIITGTYSNYGSADEE